MQPAHTATCPAQDAHASGSIRYEDWRQRIQTATELDQLVAAVEAYLAEWRPRELAMLPAELSQAPLSCSEDIPYRAVVAAQAELKIDPDAPSAIFLREMALTLMAAASRLRFLTTLRAREGKR